MVPAWLRISASLELRSLTPLPAVSLFSGCGPLHPQIQHMDPTFKGEVQWTRKVGFHFPRCRLFLSALVFAATVIQLYGAPHPLPHNWLLTKPAFVHISSGLWSDSTSHRFCVHRETPACGSVLFLSDASSVILRRLLFPSVKRTPEKLNYCKWKLTDF